MFLDADARADVVVDADADVNVVVDANVVAVVCLDAPEMPVLPTTLDMFGFQRLDAYRAAIEFLGGTSKLVTAIPKGHGAPNSSRAHRLNGHWPHSTVAGVQTHDSD